ncbi:MAG: hypothetical protein JO288_08720 [Hyphomicrobiales bacterium]|nr:hypothetical protein [Hyphomicrobiales bacterium]
MSKSARTNRAIACKTAALAAAGLLVFSPASATTITFAGLGSDQGGGSPYTEYRLTFSAPGGFVGPFTAAPVPEASSWAMLIAGFAGLGFAGYRRRTIVRLGGLA